MVDEIEGIGKKRKSEEPLVWKPWTPPPGFAPPAAKVEAPKPMEAKPRLTGDRNGTGPLNLDAAVGKMLKAQKVDLDNIDVPGAAPAEHVGPVDAAKALGELGVIASLSQVALAYARTPVSFAHMAESLEAFASNLTKVTDQLHQVPGVGEALATFGGIGGVVAGVMGFKEELANIQQDGLNLGNGLGIASSSAQFVGGVATALSALCPPLAPVGASIMAASAALKLGKLGWENRSQLKAGAEAVGKAVQQTTRIVGDKGAAIVGNNSAAIVANNGANMVGQRRPWAWMTG
jgi:hypothetical protein